MKQARMQVSSRSRKPLYIKSVQRSNLLVEFTHERSTLQSGTVHFVDLWYRADMDRVRAWHVVQNNRILSIGIGRFAADAPGIQYRMWRTQWASLC